MKNLPRSTPRGRVVLLIGSLATAAGAPLGFTDITRAGMFADALVLLAWLFVAFQTTRTMPVMRSLRDSSGSAQVLEVGHTYTADLFLTGRSQVDGTLTEHQSLSHDEPQWPLTHRGSAYSYEVTPRHRGQFIAGPATFATHDPLGLVAATAQSRDTHTWLIWPPIAVIEQTSPRYPADGDDVISSPLAHYAGSPGGSIREYTQGDDMRIVHWPASAHRGELMVRQFDPPADSRVVLTFTSGLESSGIDDEWEWMISAAASLFVALISNHVSTSIVTNHDEAQAYEAGLDALARLGACEPPKPLATAPTVLFAHSSGAVDIPRAPVGVIALALACGPSAENLASRLMQSGWQSFIVDTTLPVGEEMSYLLDRLGVR